ncbi:hypothetical protein FS837_008053 [Tulasnella sp. UAMH 9824]|nr:hypothetical protein FS837_008053 [Tulasnella sp. UAMH 9824]
MHGEPVKRRVRTLGLSVFNPDYGSDDDSFRTQPDTRQPTTKQLPSPKALPIPGAAQGSYLPQQPPLQELQSPSTARPPQPHPTHPIHSSPSSPSSVPTPASSYQPQFQLTNEARQADAQSSPRYASALPSLPLTESKPAVTVRSRRNSEPGVPNRDPSGDGNAPSIQRNTPQTTARPLQRPFLIPGLAKGSQQPPLQELQSPFTPSPAQHRPSHSAHSASLSTSSIPIPTSFSQPSLQLPGGPRRRGALRIVTHNNVGSSSSSRSSPSRDTTPTPKTPSNAFSPVSFAGGVAVDRKLDGRLDAAAGADHPTSLSLSPSRSDAENSTYDGHMRDVPQAQPTIIASPIKFDRQGSHDKLIITVTNDESDVIVDITGAENAAFIRNCMFSKLRITDEGHENYQIYRVKPGQAALGDPLTDDQLMMYCGTGADAKGTLMFRVQHAPTSPVQPQSAPPAHEAAPSTDLTALERCLHGLKHLFIDMNRLRKEAGYAEKRGGYGNVRVCRLDSGTPRSKLVAAKRIHLGERKPEAQRLVLRLARELKVWAALQHPHVLPLLGYYLDTDYHRAILISEYQIHGDLKDYLEQEKPSWDMRLQLTRDSTDGLAYLHGRSPPVRHGDLKTANVFINAKRQAMLADFGLSKSLESGPTGLTTSNGLKGTLRYYSPELLKEQEEVSYELPSDIWAWGCLAVEVLTDRIPYAGKNTEPGVFSAIIAGKPPSEIEDLPIPVPELKLLLAKCWKPEPSERPPASHCLRTLNSATPVSQIYHHIESTSAQQDSRANDEEAKEQYYDSDSSENGPLWGMSSIPSTTIIPPAIKTSGSEEKGNSIFEPSPNQATIPRLTLTISPLVSDHDPPTPKPIDASHLPTSRKKLPTPSPIFGLTPTSPTLAAFGRDTWPYRPVEEYILDHLEDFFPNHDLDEPFIDQVEIATEGPQTQSSPSMKWVKGELIGKGAYSRVFLALNGTTGEMIAVKQVEMPQSMNDPDGKRQANIVKVLEGEQQTLEKLDHPNIVQYLGFEKTKEFASILLEYVPGGSIGGCLRRFGKFDENMIKSFTGQIIEGLVYLHANKIIHRDIKADNVLVDPSGNCKISDFVNSRQNENIYENAAMTVMRGSLYWMAPEMLQDNEKGYSAKIDIWSLGCIFMEMFAGRRPWEQDDFPAVMNKLGKNKMAPPVPSDVHLSAGADDFRLRCFTQDPDERPTAEGLKGHPWLDLPPEWIFSGFN